MEKISDTKRGSNFFLQGEKIKNIVVKKEKNCVKKKKGGDVAKLQKKK